MGEGSHGEDVVFPTIPGAVDLLLGDDMPMPMPVVSFVSQCCNSCAFNASVFASAFAVARLAVRAVAEDGIAGIIVWVAETPNEAPSEAKGFAIEREPLKPAITVSLITATTRP